MKIVIAVLVIAIGVFAGAGLTIADDGSGEAAALITVR